MDDDTDGDREEIRVTDPGDGQRLHLIDALRGIAAVAVLLFHLTDLSPQHDIYASAFPHPVHLLLDYARNGVVVFFVISGFVIGYSLRTTRPGASEYGNFMVRRQARLDPPYWAAMVLALAIGTTQKLFPSLVTTTYSVKGIAANAVYLQGLLGVRPVLGVSWTLCLEVQFYLVLLVIGFALQRVPKGDGPWPGMPRHLPVAVFGSGSVSMFLGFWVGTSGALFIGTWYLFAGGLLVCCYLLGLTSGRVVAAYAAATVVYCVMIEAGTNGVDGDPWRSQWFAVATLTLLAVAVRQRWLFWTGGRVLQWCGRLSYSIYLVHLPVIDVVMAGLFKVTGDSRVGALAAWPVGLAACLVAAAVFHRLVEAPSNALSRRLKHRRTVIDLTSSDEAVPANRR